MNRFCGRCGREFILTDLVLRAPGCIARHYVRCPSTWGVAWKSPIVTIFPDGPDA